MSIPYHLKESLDAYASEGRPTGDFLRAVLENDLMEAFGRADLQSRSCMFDICSYVYNDMPGPCHGSPEKVTAWIELFKKKRINAFLTEASEANPTFTDSMLEMLLRARFGGTPAMAEKRVKEWHES